jgi:hypothetical protein
VALAFPYDVPLQIELETPEILLPESSEQVLAARPASGT